MITFLSTSDSITRYVPEGTTRLCHQLGALLHPGALLPDHLLATSSVRGCWHHKLLLGILCELSVGAAVSVRPCKYTLSPPCWNFYVNNCYCNPWSPCAFSPLWVPNTWRSWQGMPHSMDGMVRGLGASMVPLEATLALVPKFKGSNISLQSLVPMCTLLSGY